MHFNSFKGLDSSILCIVIKLYIWLEDLFKTFKGTDFLYFTNFRIWVHYDQGWDEVYLCPLNFCSYTVKIDNKNVFQDNCLHLKTFPYIPLKPFAYEILTLCLQFMGYPRTMPPLLNYA